MWNFLLMLLLFLSSLFLILLVLVQRGRGGGLAGAFGGLGGQSAFGTKAGDLFTRITIGVAAFWIILSAYSVSYFGNENRGMIAPDLGASSAAAAKAKSGDKSPAAAGGDTSPAGTESKSPESGAPSGPQLPANTETAPGSSPEGANH